MTLGKTIPRLLLHANAITHPSSQALKLLSFSSISISQPTDPHHLSEAAQQICHAIRHQPEWEFTLLSHFDLSHPTLLHLVLSSPSISSNPFLSLNLLTFLSSNHIPVPSTLLAPCLTKCLTLFFSTTTNLDQAFATFCHITTTFHFAPPLSVWNAALSACLRAGRTDLVFSLYQRMTTSGDEATAGYLIQAFCKEEKLVDAYLTLREFSKNGVLPDVASISKLVAAFVRIRNYEKVSELLHLMIAGKRMPDIFTYHSIIQGLCDNGMRDEGFRIFNELKLRGYRIDMMMYNTMIDGLCKMGQMIEAKRLWSEMVGKGIWPDHYTYTTIIDGYFKCGDLEEGKKLYNEMIEKGYGESTVSCSMMINGLCLNGLMIEAISVFEEMASKGIEKDVITYSTLIQGLCKEGRTVEAMRLYIRLLEAGLQPDVLTYTPIIVALCNQGKVTEAAVLVKIMKDRGLEPLVSTNDCIVTAFCKAGKEEEGMAWLVKMLEKNLRPRPVTFNRLVEYLSFAGQVDEMLSMLNKMFAIGCSLKRSVCYLIVDKLCRDGRLQAKELFEKILLTND